MEIPKADGDIGVNTWEDLQPKTFTALRENQNLWGQFTNVPIYPIGPLTGYVVESSVSLSSKILSECLEKQLLDPLFFVSFGSGGTLSFDQVTQIALGLELIQQRSHLLLQFTSGGIAASFTSYEYKKDKKIIILITLTMAHQNSYQKSS